MREAPFTELLLAIVDNRGRTAPTAPAGLPLIATNCIIDDALYPVLKNVRYVDTHTYETWFRAHPEPGDILFVCKGSPGRVALVPDPVPFCIAQDMVAIRPDPQKVYPRYLFAALRSSTVRHQIDSMHVGTLIPHFKKGDFDKLQIPLPEPAIQKWLGDCYFAMSDKIESNRHSMSLLEELADAFFVQRFLDSGSGKRRRLGDYIEFTKGKKPPETSAEPSEGYLPYLNMDVMAGRKVTYAPAASGAVISTHSDIIMVMDGAAGIVFPGRPGVVGSTFARVDVLETSLRDVLLRALIHYSPEIRRHNTGSAIPHVDKNVVLDLPLSIPELYEEAAAQLRAMHDRQVALRTESEALAVLRDALLRYSLSPSVGAVEKVGAPR